jgi:hypothetical protein
MAHIVIRLDIGSVLSPDKNGILWRARYAHVFDTRRQAQRCVDKSLKYSNRGGYGWMQRDYLIVALPKSYSRSLET